MPVFDKKDTKRTVQSVMNELVERTNGNTQRLRLLEQRTEAMDSQMTTLEKDILDHSKEMKKLVQDVETHVSTIDEKFLKMENTVKEVVNHMKHLATSSEVRGLQELIDIYNPLKSNFVTKDELDQFIEKNNK
jgi:uncharacterized protein YoxC